MQKSYTSISPSAKALLLTKALTDIPYIADAAKLVWGDSVAAMGKPKQDNPMFWGRLLHFEVRYKSVDQMLAELGGTNIFEISSGYSFRGLHMAVTRSDVFYVDTDLPGVVEDKLNLLDRLVETKDLNLQSELIIKSLNALDENEFIKIIDLFPPGPITIVNEGLLMYLNNNEKSILCQIIHKILKQRGGYWITADIYIKKELGQSTVPDQFSQFLAAHNVEENKFESFTQAEEFFNAQGFKIHKKASPIDRQTLSALNYIDPKILQTYAQKTGSVPRIRETWALKAM